MVPTVVIGPPPSTISAMEVTSSTPLAVLTLMNTALGLYCQPTTIRSGRIASAWATAGAERPGVDAVGQLKDHLPGTHVVEDRGPPQNRGLPPPGRDVEQDRVLWQGASPGWKSGSPPNANPGVLADQRPPGHGELVVAVGDRSDAVDVVDGAVHVEHQPTGVGGVPPALAQLPGEVFSSVVDTAVMGELERALCLVVG